MRVAVLFGGTNSERDVSIATAGQVFRALRDRGHDVSAFDTTAGKLKPSDEDRLMEATVPVEPPDLSIIPGADVTMQLLSEPGGLRSVDVVFLALHGGTGENGTIQGLLDLAGVPYTGSGVLASAVAMDKDVSKRLFRLAGVPTPDWYMVGPEAEFDDQLGCPVVVKPNKQGSTVGLTVVKDPALFADAVRVARLHDEEVMVEKFVPGREFVIGVLGGEALAVGEIIPQGSEIFDYRNKYQVDGAVEIFPAQISDAQADEMRSLAVQAHNALKLGNYSRVDFRVDSEGRMWCLEANTLPGMTATSLLPQSAAVVGIGFAELCEKICENALTKR
ncbi:D-alanine--D-alanine ligase [Nocardia sp. CS682]|uniref:D-alanine--D-alanine ligase family protein n=1 Tax=Nocardia sp. CS682 TaxID=1047172 RepID=UPI001074C825|nr:D-alanine--D-alanine ligase [Nocardia sp. CS682]QBS40491.1 D-alanine--D-alanine ligase [Nocardia sp. CS682]